MRSALFTLSLAVPLALLSAGCAMRQDPPPPVVTGAAAGWIDPARQGPLAGDWWRALGDARLDALMARALSASPDLAEAQARLRAARASVDAARGRQLPQLGAAAAATTNAQSANGMIPFGKLPGVSRTYDLFDAGFDASWEIDLWGARASATRAAAARGRQAEAQLAATRLSLTAEVARDYIELRSAQARRANLAAQVDTLAALAALQQARLAAGETPRDDSLATHQRLDAARAALAPLSGEAAANAYALGVLTGRPPEVMGDLLDTEGPMPHMPQVAWLGLRSDVLARRPDVQAALADLAAARADADVAHAALFPSLSLTGSIGQQARQTGDFLAGDSLRYGLGPSLHWPLFAGGQLRAQLRGARAQADAAAARYEKAVLAALSDSETAINRHVRAEQAGEAAQNAAASADSRARIARARFESGEDNRLLSLEAQLTALAAHASALAARTGEAEAYIALGKALGIAPAP
ncbi:MAG: efflux transporter outer membrane subunit [Sphingomonadales bacterium]|nr:efflux transporter outer membrane subunit [Sphingomonadales bacterium]MDE2167838.1 efflux transporter outer membrane subunit [Sphingomonadales bacterium]